MSKPQSTVSMCVYERQGLVRHVNKVQQLVRHCISIVHQVSKRTVVKWKDRPTMVPPKGSPGPRKPTEPTMSIKTSSQKNNICHTIVYTNLFVTIYSVNRCYGNFKL